MRAKAVWPRIANSSTSRVNYFMSSVEDTLLRTNYALQVKSCLSGVSIMGILQYSWTTLLANILIPAGILTFSSGFFPYKPLLPGLATFDEVDQDATSPIFDKVVFMVVDALRR
jgi:hypothetical protein